MQHTRKLLALVLALVIVMALATTAFADGDSSGATTAGTATITVNNALSGATYSAYKVFDVTTSGGSKPSYAYTITGGSESDANPFFDTVKNFANNADNGLTLTQITGTNTYNVTFASAFDETKAKELAVQLTNAVNNTNNNITTRYTANATTDSDPKATISNLPLGCYLVPSPIGSSSVLITAVDNTAAKDEKNGLPNLTKEVNKADASTATEAWADCNDVDFGRAVEFKIEIQVDNTSDDYVLTDTLPTGFSLDDKSVTVKYAEKASGAADNYKDPETVAATNGTSTNYVLSTTPDSSQNENWAFKITFKGDYLATLKPADKLIVTYSATVGTGATVGDKGNTNTAKLTYGSNRDLTDSTTTYIWSFGVKKVDDSAPPNPLAGAKFKLYKDYDAKNGTFKDDDLVNFTKKEKTDTTYQYSSTSITSEITTDSTGSITFEGLDSGTYYLLETEAPAGYNRLEGPIKVVISAKENTSTGTLSSSVEFGNWQPSVDGGTDTHYTDSLTSVKNRVITVTNQKGTELPSTGGIGTTIFYVLGGILVVGAGVLLVTKKRMNNAK